MKYNFQDFQTLDEMDEESRNRNQLRLVAVLPPLVKMNRLRAMTEAKEKLGQKSEKLLLM